MVRPLVSTEDHPVDVQAWKSATFLNGWKLTLSRVQPGLYVAVHAASTRMPSPVCAASAHRSQPLCSAHLVRVRARG